MDSVPNAGTKSCVSRPSIQASSHPRLRRLHPQHRQHFADLRCGLAGLKVNDKPQPDIGDAGELVLPQLRRFARPGSQEARMTGGDGAVLLRPSGFAGWGASLFVWDGERAKVVWKAGGWLASAMALA
jgi:hypothetical protein